MNDKAAKRAQEKAARARMIGQGRKSLDQVREELKAERGTSGAFDGRLDSLVSWSCDEA